MADFERIYSEHFAFVYKYMLSLSYDENLAEEITQETFFKALKAVDSFNGQCKMNVWLCQIAKNTYFSYLKKQKTHSELKDEHTIDGFEKDLIDNETSKEIHQIIHDLDEPYKEVFSLRMFGELSFKEIAELFGKTESWARVTYYRAKSKIKGELKCKYLVK